MPLLVGADATISMKNTEEQKPAPAPVPAPAPAPVPAPAASLPERERMPYGQAAPSGKQTTGGMAVKSKGQAKAPIDKVSQAKALFDGSDDD